MIEIIKEHNGDKFYIDDGSGKNTLLSLLQEYGLVISAPCNGKGLCGRCRVRFLEGVTEPTQKERKLLCADELAEGIRLACEVRVRGACRVQLPDIYEEEMRILTGSEMQTNKNAAAQSLPEQNCGIVIDIGTTTLAAELIDLSDGKILASASGVNHQRAYGADVIARIAAANEGKNTLLQKSICTDAARLIGKLAGIAGGAVPAEMILQTVSEIAVVGNTTMCHLLRGLSCEGLGRVPFTPADNTWYETDAKTLFGIQNCLARVTILPGISAFVGADIVAGIVASRIDEKSGINLLLDIGTNGEMALAKEGKLFVTSTAAGPVFEGGNILCGMPGVSGAIAHMTKHSAEKSWCYETIGNQPPIGLCGTGIIDLTAILLEQGYMDENGTLIEPWFTDGVAVADTALRFTQRDMREVQMGKAAIRAGIEILSEKSKSDIQKVYLAGGFGYFMDIENAIQIGMFPEHFRDRVSCMGNSAVKGTVQYLMDRERTKRRIDQMLERAIDWNLAEHPAFEELYFKHMSF